MNEKGRFIYFGVFSMYQLALWEGLQIFKVLLSCITEGNIL